MSVFVSRQCCFCNLGGANLRMSRTRRRLVQHIGTVDNLWLFSSNFTQFPPNLQKNIKRFKHLINNLTAFCQLEYGSHLLYNVSNIGPVKYILHSTDHVT